MQLIYIVFVITIKRIGYRYISLKIKHYISRMFLKVITADARNHGDSPHTPELNYQLMAEDLKFLMEELNVKKASLIGHSMGGRTIMYFGIVYVRFVLLILFL